MLHPNVAIQGDLIVYGKIVYKEKPDVIDNIKPGDKIMIKDDEMFIDKRTRIMRSLSSDNRYKTLDFLKKSYKHYRITRDDFIKILDCLKITYKDDQNFLDIITKTYPSTPLLELNMTGGIYKTLYLTT